MDAKNGLLLLYLPIRTTYIWWHLLGPRGAGGGSEGKGMLDEEEEEEEAGGKDRFLSKYDRTVGRGGERMQQKEAFSYSRVASLTFYRILT